MKKLLERVKCPHCNSGTGPCSSCGGTGYKSENLDLSKKNPCIRCHGSGRMLCNQCSGTGQITRVRGA